MGLFLISNLLLVPYCFLLVGGAEMMEPEPNSALFSSEHNIQERYETERFRYEVLPGKKLWADCEWSVCLHLYKIDQHGTCKALDNKKWVNFTHQELGVPTPIETFHCPSIYYSRQMCCHPVQPYAIEECIEYKSCVWGPKRQPGKKADCKKKFGEYAKMLHVVNSYRCKGRQMEEFCCRCSNKECKTHLTSSLFGLPPRKKEN